MTGLQHSFVHGLRFRGVPECASHGLYRRLPTAPPSPSQSAASVCLEQCLALLGHPRRVPAGAVTDAASVLALLGPYLPEHRLQVSAGGIDAGRVALLSLRNGGVVLAQLVGGPRSDWVLVAGVEWVRNLPKDAAAPAPSPGRVQALALLVLDATAPWVWACGHNARVELAVAGEGPDPSFRYATLDGVLRRVRVAELVTAVPA